MLLPQLDNLLCLFPPELVQLVEEVLPALKDNMTVWVVDHTSPSEDFSSLLDKLEHMSGEPLSDPPNVDIMSNFLFIFTSGTTGTAQSLYSLVITLPTAKNHIQNYLSFIALIKTSVTMVEKQ